MKGNKRKTHAVWAVILILAGVVYSTVFLYVYFLSPLLTNSNNKFNIKIKNAVSISPIFPFIFLFLVLNKDPFISAFT